MAKKTYTAESILQELTSTGVCNIPGVVKLTVIDKPARQGRNPATGEVLNIAAKKGIKASVLKAAKAAVNS